MNHAKPSSNRLYTLLSRGITAALVAIAATGCAGVQADGPSPRLPVRQERATIVIEGQGTVQGGEIACTSTSSAVCTAHFEELWATMLEAKAAPGWRFAGWERQAAPSFGAAPGEPEVVYTAMFEPETRTDVARNEVTATH